MTALVLAVLSGIAVLRLFGLPRRWPWRVADLSDPYPSPSRSEVRSAGGPRSEAPARRERPARSPRRTGRDDWAVERDLPGAVDMLAVAISAGHSLHTAVGVVADKGSGPVSAGLRQVVAAFDRGAALSDELARLPDRLGPATRPLATTLIVASSSGAPLGPALQRLADAERVRLRRRTEERVRRLPVLLLAPLIGLVLPAFVLLTIVPVALATAGDGLTSVAALPAASLTDLSLTASPAPTDRLHGTPP